MKVSGVPQNFRSLAIAQVFSKSLILSEISYPNTLHPFILSRGSSNGTIQCKRKVSFMRYLIYCSCWRSHSSTFSLNLRYCLLPFVLFPFRQIPLIANCLLYLSFRWVPIWDMDFLCGELFVQEGDRACLICYALFFLWLLFFSFYFYF